ncbi:adenosylmethionine--8-amino-7-oxononanoate transaminase [Chitinophagaceae bacterium 26-R-25]|nr:adenosylmethionine--8-amino-7-oxononanoate transaminase [Chitinophagaceae bacterium 26-R-25]
MQSLQKRDQSVIWHPFSPLKNMPEPIPIVKGEGVYIIDESGNKYIDGISSWWVNIHGHAHPYIAEKIYKQALQLEHVIFAGFTHYPAVELAERLLPILPGKFSKIFYSDNGSTAAEVALKMAIQYWWNKSENEAPARKKILAFEHSYHGDTFGAMSVSERGIFTKAFHNYLFDVVFIDTPTADNIDQLTSFIAANGHEIAGFIYEPLIQGSGGMRMYDAALMNTLLETAQQHNIICIADEVMTGFGRTGKIFASEHMTVKPDIICLSKGLTGGTMALGITACNDKIVEAFTTDDRLKTFFHGHSFTANPLACSAALASLDLLQREECQASIKNICEQHSKFMRVLEQKHSPVVKNIRQTGTIIAFEISIGKDEYLNTVNKDFSRLMMQQGVYLRPLGNTVYIMSPYCITTEELQKVYKALLGWILLIES